MYAAHFGLREAPFGITPDTSYFFGSPRSQEALNTLLVAARGGEGFIKITGKSAPARPCCAGSSWRPSATASSPRISRTPT